jgi:putative MATE family efflux protein
MENVDFTRMSISKAIGHIALPMIFITFFNTLYSLVDMFWVGRLGYEQIAAVGLFGIFFDSVVVFNEIVGIGSTPLITRNYGAKNYQKVNEVFKQTLFLKLLIAFVFCFIGIFFMEDIMVIFGAQGDVITYGILYGRIMSVGLLFVLSSVTLATAMRGVGDPRTPMKILVLSNVMNIVLDPVLIIWAGLGVRGAAIASVMSQMVAFSIGIFLVTTGRHLLAIDRKVKFDFKVIKTILRIGIPAGIESLGKNLTNIITVRIVAGFGMTALAGFQIFFKVMTVPWMLIFGLVLACETLVGHNLGASKPERAEKTALKSGYIGTVIMIAFGAVFFIFSKQIVSFFNSTEAVVQTGSACFLIASPFLAFLGFTYPLSGAFYGSGDTKPLMIITFTVSFCYQIPLMVIISTLLGVNGVFLAYGSAMFVGFCITLAWFSRGKWKERKLE